ncbi:hypothetical protein HPB50_014317 [Hyalomma asiaticum]|uniref:Uncharacterized protein n=1 Tax=Hyalomma asiaticum TaxID=266040 RepID=A0ACB7RIS9_HYAAI|nr:hypothetical protein HPB50_014317 [Hyalomma asiaticum]
MDENMTAARALNIFRHLLDPSSTRMVSCTEMAKLRHRYKDVAETLVEEVVQAHLTRPDLGAPLYSSRVQWGS